MSAAAFGASSVHDFTMNAINGTPTPLANYKGKIMLVVNVASQCGYTYQYEALQALYVKYKDKGLVVEGSRPMILAPRNREQTSRSGRFASPSME